jgi:class 3 adenylate cyclase
MGVNSQRWAEQASGVGASTGSRPKLTNVTCPNCGADNVDRARFCFACGTAVGRDSPEARKVVTVLFADVSGSTALGERLDPESVRKVMGRFFAEARTIIERHGGIVEKFIGDAVMGVFGIPVVHEETSASSSTLHGSGLRPVISSWRWAASATRNSCYGAAMRSTNGLGNEAPGRPL